MARTPWKEMNLEEIEKWQKDYQNRLRGYRPPSVTLRRPGNVDKEKTIEEITKGWAEAKARERAQTAIKGVPSFANFAGPRGITTEEKIPKESIGFAERQAKMTPREPSPAPIADVGNSRFLRMPESARKEPFLDYPKTAAPEKKLGFLEGLDEDTRRNLMLSALTTGLKLMSSQRWSTTPPSPVADIGEAGLTGLQTYVGLAAADRKERLLEAERQRKELADKLTGEYRQKTLGFQEEEAARWRKGGIKEEETKARIASMEPYKEVVTSVSPTGVETKEFIEKSKLGTILTKTIQPDTVAVEEYNPETAETYTKRISKKEQGEFLKKPGGVIKEITDQFGNTELVKIVPGPGGRDISVPIPGTKGTSAQVIAARERAKATDYKEKREFLDRKVKNILASANIEMTAEEAVKFDPKQSNALEAFLTAKGKVLSATEKARIKRELKDAWDAFESAVAPRIGPQAEKKKPSVPGKPLSFD